MGSLSVKNSHAWAPLSVVDLDSLDPSTDPDPAFQVNPDPDLDTDSDPRF
jgi:hypothetical protein